MLFNNIFIALFALLLAVVVQAAPTDPSPYETHYGKCPDPSKCHYETVGPVCKPGEICPQWRRRVVICPWQCGDKDVPKGCTQRCKPCKPGILCPAICICQIECSAIGSCTVGYGDGN